MDVLGFGTLVVVGFTACAEFGSYAFVHPVIRRLPSEHHLAVEQGLLRTFGRVMPVLMPASAALAVGNALVPTGQAGPAVWRWSASAALVAAVVVTLLVNVRINLATGRWDPADPPPYWQRVRRRWEVFQGVRSWLLLAGFVLLCVGFAAG